MKEGAKILCLTGSILAATAVGFEGGRVYERLVKPLPNPQEEVDKAIGEIVRKGASEGILCQIQTSIKNQGNRPDTPFIVDVFRNEKSGLRPLPPEPLREEMFGD